MGVYIPNMEMPDGCVVCPFFIENRHDRGDDSLCRASRKEVKCGCPLVPVPPHGRLIDADVAEVILFSDEDAKGDFCDGILFAADWISEQPTIIEAEEGE